MRIDLASTDPQTGGPNWVEAREQIKGGDIFAAREANKVPLDEDGRPAEFSFQAAEDQRLIALAARVITGWSFQVPVPSALPDPASALKAARSVLSDFTGADLRAFRAGMRPLLDEVSDEGPDTKSSDVPAGSVAGGPAPEAEG